MNHTDHALTDLCVCVCVCVRACVHACVRACVCLVMYEDLLCQVLPRECVLLSPVAKLDQLVLACLLHSIAPQIILTALAVLLATVKNATD